jgi:hypothetical protein
MTDDQTLDAGLLRTAAGDHVGTLLTLERQDDGLHFGTIDLSQADAGVLALLYELEEMINGIILSLLDQVMNRIEALGISWIRDGGAPLRVYDVQINPTERLFGFRLAPRRK